MLMDQYAQNLTQAISNIAAKERDNILAAAALVKRTIANDGLIYVFGCGHSGILSEESFYRAGGLACVSPMFYEPLMLHESASLSSRLEKQTGLAPKVLEHYDITPKDLVFCVSTSGVNAVPVEVTAALREKGVDVVAITSSSYASQAVKNPVGKHLYEVASLWIDSQAPHGDACLRPVGLPVAMTPMSTVCAAYIINSVLAEGTQLALDAGLKVPVYLSGNIPGGAEANQALIDRYKPRIRHL